MKKIKLFSLAISAIGSVAITQVATAQEENRSNNFVRMFPNLPSFAPQNDETRAAAEQIGVVSGLMDAQDDLSDPVQSIVNQPEFSPNNLDNPNMTAGVTFIGQFLDHDITLDNRSPIDELANPETALNERTAAFDLDSVYGAGPLGSFELYELTPNGIKFKVDTIPGSEAVSRGGVPRFDLHRNEDNVAFLGDGRNDENSILSQLHLSIMMFHNAVTDEMMADASASFLTLAQIFTEAQRVVQWHYQWIVLNEFLPLTIGQERVDTILSEGLQHYQIGATTGAPAACTSFEDLPIQSASSDFPFDAEFSPALAIDGIVDPLSRWSSFGEGNSIVLDLGDNNIVSQLSTAWFQGNIRTAFFDVETSTDLIEWQNVAENVAFTGTTEQADVDVQESEARYVRIVGRGNSNTLWNSLVEVNILGCSDTTTTTTTTTTTPSASNPQIPIEFAAAAYRFGHSQIRPSYRLNFGSDDESQFFAFILDIRVDPNSTDPDDLRGGVRAPRRFVDWQTFFDFGDGNVRQNKIIDTQLTTNLFQLPGQGVPSPGLPDSGPLSLMSRNLIRHVNFGVPSGQDIAREMGITPLDASVFTDLAAANMDESTPLWFYVLKEAEVVESGLRLGPVGSTIVGEVFVGLLQGDDDSYLAVEPDWTPTLPSREGEGEFGIVDLLEYAGMVFPLDVQ